MTDRLDDWLADLDLSKYREAFTENEIVFGDIALLTEDDLKEVGLPVGPRRRALEAIAKLGNGQLPAPVKTPVLVQPNLSPVVERRHLTVMFCDLVGSTQLSRQLDPEDLRDVMRRYQDVVSGAVTRYGGHIAKYLGDGILAYFGWPHAYEDQAERAVRSGLEATQCVARVQLTDKSGLAARVGIATGQVVVGDLVGEAGRDAEAVSGETPNLAARLQQTGAAGEVITGAETKDLVAHQFKMESLGKHRFKGFEEDVPAWRVGGEIKTESRFAAAHGQGLSRFVGRQSELNILKDRWTLAKSGEGQIVLLSGEAGIGKSRITQTLSDHTREDEHFRLQYQCSPHHVNSPLYPAVRQLEFAAGIAPETPATVKLDKLEQLLEQSDNVDVAPLMAAFLDLPSEGRYPPLDLTPQEQKQQTLQALTEIFVGLAGKRPVFFIFEDAHWIDPTTRELMDLLVERTATLPALILVTFRPEFDTTWAAHTHCTVLALNRLGSEACANLISDVTGGLDLPEMVFEHIVSKTDGIPLFVEELTKMVLKSGLLSRQGDHYELDGPLPPLAIPSTLQDSLMARLDQLDTLKEIAQIGAAVGREFSHSLLEAVSPLGGDKLKDALDQLIGAEIIFRRGVQTEASYIFKHALIQDAAYASLLRSKRQQIHASIAKALLTRFEAQVQTEPEQLALHYTQAGMLPEAADYWLLAGQRAIARSANSEAIAHLIEGLTVVGQCPKTEKRSSVELDIQIGLGSARIAARGYSAEETEKAWLRARQLLDVVGEDARQFIVLHGLCMVYWNRAQLIRLRDVNDDMLLRASRQSDVLPKLVAHRLMSVGCNPMGRFDLARENGERATKLYDPVAHRNSAHRFGHDLGVASHWHLAIALLFLGHLQTSAEVEAKATSLSADLQNVNTNSYNSLWSAFTRLVRCDWEGAKNVAEPMIEDALSRSMALWVAFGRHMLGSALVNLDQQEEGLKQLHLGREEAEGLNNRIFLPMTLRFEAQALKMLNRHEDAICLLDKALDVVETTGESWWEPDIHRLKAEYLPHLKSNKVTQEESFNRALAVTKLQNSRLPELRCACSFVQFLYRQDRIEEARELFIPKYNWFSEGGDALDLKIARQVMKQLA
ncbi:Adenylate cyclase 2 [Roseibium album]|nr:Adenylate cyclase 2 [Roseibium album]